MTPSKTPPKTNDNKNALLASIVSHKTNNNNLNMFGFFQQLAEAEARAKEEAEEAARKAEEEAEAARKAEETARLDAEETARLEAERKRREEAERKRREEAERKRRAEEEAENDVLNKINEITTTINNLNEMRVRYDLSKSPPDITSEIDSLITNINKLNELLINYTNTQIVFSWRVKNKYNSLINDVNTLLISHNINRIQHVISPGSSPQGLVGKIRNALQNSSSSSSPNNETLSDTLLFYRRPLGRNKLIMDSEAKQISDDLENKLNNVNKAGFIITNNNGFNFIIQGDYSRTPEAKEIIKQTNLTPQTRTSPIRPASPSPPASSSARRSVS